MYCPEPGAALVRLKPGAARIPASQEERLVTPANGIERSGSTRRAWASTGTGQGKSPPDPAWYLAKLGNTGLPQQLHLKCPL